MFVIEMPDHSECRTLPHSDRVFHEALADGEKRYHIKNSGGEDYDIVHIDNDTLKSAMPGYADISAFPSYDIYDEYDKESIWLKLFHGKSRLVFEELNEYTIAITKTALMYTGLEVYCSDARILWFTGSLDSGRIHVQDALPEYEGEAMLYIRKEPRTGVLDNFGYFSALYAFHNLFVLQWLTGGKPVGRFQYVDFQLPEYEGIGRVLISAKNFEAAFQNIGLKMFVSSDKLGKFRVQMLNRYFDINLSADGADGENTVKVPETSFVYLLITAFVNSARYKLDVNMLSRQFRAELDEYYDALFAGKKVLGILIRGTDYVVNYSESDRRMATVEEMVSTIYQWLEEDGYDCIFLATEDKDVLAKMREEFGSKVLVVAQERHSISEFTTSAVISDLEKEQATEEEYDAVVEDNTINYFYAVYLLSKCSSFMCSGQCNGYDMVRDFNEGRFERIYKFQVGMTEFGKTK